MSYERINIVGSGNGFEHAPYDNCWGINSVIFSRPVDILFDMHKEPYMQNHQRKRRKKVIECAGRLNIPVYSCEEIEGTTYVKYPIKKVIKKFPTGFFSNAVCYAIALALLIEFKEIHFYGVVHSRVDMLGEYSLQKPGVDYWLGAAMALGVNCVIHGIWSEIGKTFDNMAYGYCISQEKMIETYG